MTFSDKLVDILNYGSVNLALGIGYSLNILETMDEARAPLTPEDLGKRCGLSPRYLTEWLGIMVTAGIVEAPSPGTYLLPKAHGDLLCKRAGNNNLGVYCQEIPLLTACAIKAVKQGFKTGDGVPFGTYPEFQSFMTELADAKHRKVLVSEFLPSVDNGKLVTQLTSGIDVCDMGCGQGTAVHLMAQAFPKSRFLGIDTHGPAIETARQKACDLNLANAEFLNRDAAGIGKDPDFQDRFDWICAFDAIHDQSHPLSALESARQMLKEDGLFSMIDIKAATGIEKNMDHPMAPFLYTVSLMHCMPVGLNDNGTGLGMMWGREKAEEFLARAGFTRVHVTDIPNDGFNLHFACRR